MFAAYRVVHPPGVRPARRRCLAPGEMKADQSGVVVFLLGTRRKKVVQLCSSDDPIHKEWWHFNCWDDPFC